MIKAVFFDLDGTLYEYFDADRIAFAALSAFAAPKLGISEEQFSKDFTEVFAKTTKRLSSHNASIHNRLIRLILLCEMHGQTFYPLAGDMSRIYWNTLMEHMVLEKGLTDLIDQLHQEGIYVGIGTNMTADIQYEKIDKLGIGSYFDGFITSEDAGFEKPDVEFFQFCADRAGVSLEECIFIGDNPKLDVKGAADAGMKSILYKVSKRGGQMRFDSDGRVIEICDYRQVDPKQHLLLG
jgi:putative hydrolase of the HAD superfamily